MKSEEPRGGHEGGGRAPYLVAPRGSRDLILLPIYTLIPQNHQGEPQKHFSTATTFCTHEIPSSDLIRLQRIYNFLLFHAVLLSILDVL